MERALRFKARSGKGFRRAGLAFGQDWTEVDPNVVEPRTLTQLAAEGELDAQIQDEDGEWVALPPPARELAQAQLASLEDGDWSEIHEVWLTERAPGGDPGETQPSPAPRKGRAKSAGA
jgi:hypothetical protein